jgi:hypothetical protein
MKLEEMDAELAAARANLRRLRESGLAELAELLDGETNPYVREFLLAKVEKMRAIGADG